MQLTVRDIVLATIGVACVLALLAILMFGLFTLATSGGTFDQMNEVVGKLSAVKSRCESIAMAIKNDSRFAHVRNEAESLYADAKTASDAAIDTAKAGVTNNFREDDVVTILDLVLHAQEVSVKLVALAQKAAETTGDYGSPIESLPDAAAATIAEVGKLVDASDARQRAANREILESLRMTAWRQLPAPPSPTGVMR